MVIALSQPKRPDMLIDPTSKLQWQEESNITWYTNIKPVCDLCGDVVDRVMELKMTAGDDATHVCFRSKPNCFEMARAILFYQYTEAEYLLMGGIRFKPIPLRGKRRR